MQAKMVPMSDSSTADISLLEPSTTLLGVL